MSILSNSWIFTRNEKKIQTNILKVNAYFHYSENIEKIEYDYILQLCILARIFFMIQYNLV